MYNERRRDSPPPKARCVYCGWHGTPAYVHLPDERGDTLMTVSAKRCPVCSRELIRIDTRPPVPIQIVTAVRAAKLTPDELMAIADALTQAPDGLSPREVAERVPAATSLITVAQRFGAQWVEFLVIAVTLVATYVTAMDAERAHDDASRAHRDAEQAHRDADRAHRDATRALRDTGELPDESIQTLADQIEAALKSRRAKQE